MGNLRRKSGNSKGAKLSLSADRGHGVVKIMNKLLVHHPLGIDSVPKDVWLDILARVASSSFTDLFHARLSCKDFLESTGDDYIYQHISIHKFPVTPWFPPAEPVLTFLTHCFNNGNPESLFRQGMIDYFKLGNVESGLHYLKMAIEKGGHLKATYVHGMILLSSGDESSHEHGLNLLNTTYSFQASNWKVDDSRERIESILRQMWVNNPISPRHINTKCCKEYHVVSLKRRGWSLDEDAQISSCETCLRYRELIYFYRLFNINV